MPGSAGRGKASIYEGVLQVLDLAEVFNIHIVVVLRR